MTFWARTMSSSEGKSQCCRIQWYFKQSCAPNFMATLNLQYVFCEFEYPGVNYELQAGKYGLTCCITQIVLPPTPDTCEWTGVPHNHTFILWVTLNHTLFISLLTSVLARRKIPKLNKNKTLSPMASGRLHEIGASSDNSKKNCKPTNAACSKSQVSAWLPTAS